MNQDRKNGRSLGGDYIEIHFEDLIEEPRQTLAQLGKFIQHDLDYDRILKVGVGSVSDPTLLSNQPAVRVRLIPSDGGAHSFRLSNSQPSRRYWGRP